MTYDELNARAAWRFTLFVRLKRLEALRAHFADEVNDRGELLLLRAIRATRADLKTAEMWSTGVPK